MPARRVVKLVTVVGARPQFIKAAAVARAITSHNATHPDRPVHEALVHTGQHYDHDMSAVFFQELGLPEPAHHLGVGSGSHGAQTGEMLKRLEAVLEAERPLAVMVYGDTNSTLAGALAAAKLHIPVAHVEAGLRSFNRRMPEEINRVVTDHLSTWFFCPSGEAVRNLAREGIDRGVHLVGDVMYDVMRWSLDRTAAAGVLERWHLERGRYALATVHRAENTDDAERLRAIFSALEALARNGMRVVVPLHPRTRRALDAQGRVPPHVVVLPPASYEEMLALEAHAQVILTDSGGVQKEAYWLGVPCVTLREETEWVETVAEGWNTLAGADPARILAAAHRERPDGPRRAAYGEGDAAARLVAVLADAV
jgi:UDP-GlcNAc3NAcA epimerase